VSTGAHLHVQRSGDLPIVDIGPLLDPASTAQAASTATTAASALRASLGFASAAALIPRPPNRRTDT